MKMASLAKLLICATLCLMVAPVAPAVAQTTKAQVFSRTQLDGQIRSMEREATEKGGSGATLGDYGSHKLMLSIRATTGAAEVHAHFDDVIVVMGGSATLITGGELIDPTTRAEGESNGTGIRNGVQQQLKEGDIVHIPAGTPHQMIIPKGRVFRVFVVKVRE